MRAETVFTERKKFYEPKIKTSLILLLAIVVLAGAAYLAMIYIVPNFNPSRGPGGTGSHGQHFDHAIRAPQLPAQEADLTGVVTSVKDNSIFVAQVNSVSVSLHVNGGQQLRLHRRPIHRGADLPGYQNLAETSPITTRPCLAPVHPAPTRRCNKSWKQPICTAITSRHQYLCRSMGPEATAAG